MDNEDYTVVAWVVGILCFAGTWIYALSQWGFLFDLIFGWILALIARVISGFIWPLIVLFLIIILGFVLFPS